MKTVFATLAAIALVTLASCGTAAPDTAALKALVVKNATDIAAFNTAVDTATDAKVLADAITAFVDTDAAYKAAFKAETDKHPEFSTLSASSMPDDLKQALADQAKAKEGVAGAVTKLNASPLLSDPAVTAAYQKMAEAAGAK